MGLTHVIEKMKCHLQANHRVRCESAAKCSLTFCWPWEMGCNYGKNTMLLTFCWLWDELSYESTPKQRSSITHPLLVMHWDCPKKKNPTLLTRCWWWVYIIKKTACHSHPVYTMQWDETLWEKNAWSLTLYEMSGIKVSSKGKAQYHLLSVGHGVKCEIPPGREIHSLPVGYGMRPLERWEFHINLHTVVHVKRFQT